MKNTDSAARCSRRHFTQLALSAGFGVSRPMLASAQEIVTALEKSNRPVVDFGLASGDVSSDAAIVWSRCDRPARMFVETAATESFRNARRYRGPVALSATDFTAKLRVTDLPPGEETFYRVVFHDLDRPGQTSVPLVGRLRTAPRGCPPP